MSQLVNLLWQGIDFIFSMCSPSLLWKAIMWNGSLIGVDLIGPLKEYQGLKYIATAICYFTKYVEAKAIPAKTGEEVGLFIYELFMRYGMMGVCISDQVK